MKSAALIAFTDRGKALALEIERSMPEVMFYKYIKGYDLKTFVSDAFRSCEALIFVSAAGIAVRAIAPYVTAKDKDPAVIVMDEHALHVIPILSGHLGGANELAGVLSDITGAETVITTATDINDKFAVDIWAKDNGFIIENTDTIKYISSAILRNEKIGFRSDVPIHGKPPRELTADDADTGIYVGIRTGSKPFRRTLTIRPRALVIGAGSRRGTPSEAFEKVTLDVLAEAELSPLSVCAMATIDIKRDEKCLKDFAGKYGIGMVTYTAKELMSAEGDFCSSDFVLKTTGADNVCERAASLASGGGRSIVAKQGVNGVTVSIYEKGWFVRF